MYRNKPCEDGRIIGEHLARLTEKSAEELSSKLDAAKVKELMPDPCPSCAFKRGTFPNGCLTTVGDALKCVMEGIPFYCHHDMNDGKPTKLCGGYLIARAALHGRKPMETPWALSHVNPTPDSEGDR